MLRVYHSNRLERLAEVLAGLLATPLGDPLAPERIAVQSPGMGTWLSHVLAERLGILANVEFLLPASFAWEIYTGQLPQVPEGVVLDRRSLLWAVLHRLGDLPQDGAFESLRRYLEGADPELRAYQLACRIADLFDQYQVYRPDWVLDWEAGGGEGWQPLLWRMIVGEGEVAHRARLGQALRRLSDQGRLDAARLPERVLVFGVTALAPVYLDLLERLGRLVDVHLLALNPSLAWWGDLTSEKELARLRARWRRFGHSDVSDYYEPGNPLLASMGAQGRELFDQLQDFNPHEVDLYGRPEGGSMLAQLQTDILTLRDAGRVGAQPLVPPEGDVSVQLHVCHSPLREVQVLHDRLLDLFERLPGLEPRQLVVMAPDIDVYAPYVSAVFGGATKERAIPWSLADRSPRAAEPLVQALLTLLELPASRLEAPEVLGLLQVPAVMRRFALDGVALGRLRQWIVESGIRWGADARERAALGLPDDPAHTWKQGLQRMFLGYAMPPDSPLFRGVRPLEGIEGPEAAWLGSLAELLACLSDWRQRLSSPRSSTQWQRLLGELLADFFLPDEPETYLLQDLRELIADFAVRAASAGLERLLPLSVIRDHLQADLAVPIGGQRFLTGQITFCNMVPMRSIPFRVVCLLGMNDLDYPRSHPPLGFDLMAAKPRPGDRSRREDDRYLFLEALLSARDVFYLSYVGRGIRDDSELQPSTLVSELLEYLERAAGASADRMHEALVTVHPLQPFSRRYFSGDERLSSYDDAWLAGARAMEQPSDATPLFVPQALPEPVTEHAEIDLEALVAFFRHPARHFCRVRLGLDLEERDQALEAAEPFSLEGIEGYRLREELLADELAGLEPLQRRERAVVGGLLPPGIPGALDLEASEAVVSGLAQRLRPLLRQPGPEVELDLALGRFRLCGWLRIPPEGGLLSWRPGRLRGQDRLALWIAHLALGAAGHGAESICLGADQGLVLSPSAEPVPALERLVSLYWEGLSRPLAFFPRSSWRYQEVLAEKGDAERAHRDALAVWTGNSFMAIPGECEDVYIQTAFRGVEQPLGPEFAVLAREVYGPLRDCSRELEP